MFPLALGGGTLVVVAAADWHNNITPTMGSGGKTLHTSICACDMLKG